MMKKKLLIILFAGLLAVSGCQSKEEAEKQKIMEAFEDMGVDYSTVIAGVLSKEWKVLDGKENYEFTKEGTGNISGDGFTYTCGVDEDNQIVLKITMDGSKEDKYYFVRNDDTGYGLYLDEADSKNQVYLFPCDTELLTMEDERANALIGEWADKSDNRYILKEDRSVVIKSASGDREGTYSVVEQKESGMVLFTLVFGSDTMEFTFEFSEDADTVELCRPGTDTIHTWTRK